MKNKFNPIRLYLFWPALVVSLLAAPSFGQERNDYKQILNLAGEQRMLSQRMSKELLLVALNHNSQGSLVDLQSSRDRFSRVFQSLRHGDAELALDAPGEDRIVKQLENVSRVWPPFETALQAGIARDSLTREDVTVIADLGQLLFGAADDTVQAYTEVAIEGSFITMVEIAMEQADRLRTLSQKTAKEYLLIAYGQNAEDNRAELKRSIEQFEAVLDGLINGNPELRLIRAPSEELQLQLKSVARGWEDWKPLLESALRGDEQTPDQIAKVASLNLVVLAESDTTVAMCQDF